MAADIVAILTDPATARSCLAAAAASALPQTRIEAFHVRRTASDLIIPSEEILPKRRREELEAMLEDRSRALQEVVEAWNASGEGQRVAWHEIVDDSVGASVATRAETADLLVFVRPDELDGGAALQAAIFDSHRLLLLVPAAAPDRAIGRHIAIAWKPSPPAERAIAAALPWLARAERISILTIGDHDDAAAAQAIALLAGQGLTGSVVSRAAGPDQVGECLLRAAHEIGADCLVMGAYRHARMVEMILGGVTRHMIKQADLPIFMIH
jgi:nucleotide-binding universal stress UspA family protein